MSLETFFIKPCQIIYEVDINLFFYIFDGFLVHFIYIQNEHEKKMYWYCEQTMKSKGLILNLMAEISA